MEPIVNGIKKQYASCIRVERVNYHGRSAWHELIFPIGSPEFALVDSSKKIIHRWFGYTETEEFTELLDPLCIG